MLLNLRGLPNGEEANRQADARFKQAHGRQSHRSGYVVQVYDLWEEPLAIVMEYCPLGLDEFLRDKLLIRRAMIPYDTARELLYGILQGLNDAHKAGLIHGDLKPGNIRFGAGASPGALGLPKLADFGAARRLREESAAVRGSSNWMAPELVRGNQATQESDYFSFGILAYLVLTGRHPYFADDPSCLTSEEDNIASATFAPADLATLRSDIPPRVAARVMELLSADPSLRLRAEQDLKAALAKASTDEEALVAPTKPPVDMEAEDWSALAEAYQEAKRLFFSEYQQKAAVEMIDAALDLAHWSGFVGKGIELVADCWSLRAFINNSGGRFDEAVDASTHGLEVDENHVNSLHARGYAFVQLRRNEEAKVDLRRAFELAENPAKRKQIRALLDTVDARLGEATVSAEGSSDAAS